MSIPVEVQETSLVRYRDESAFKLSTSDQTMMTQLRRLGYKPISAGPYEVYSIPKNKLTIRKAAGRKRKVLSEAAKVKLRDNLKKARASKAANADRG